MRTLLLVIFVSACAHSKPEEKPSGPFTKQQIADAMAPLKPKLASCQAQQPKGHVNLEAVVLPTGEVMRVQAVDQTGGTPTAQCLEDAMLTAKFPAFSGENYVLHYPVDW